MQVKNYKAGENYVAYNADTVEVCAELDEGSVDYIIYSPPFSSLYTFSNDERDMSNCANHDEFFEHFDYLVKSLYRALAPGRLMSVHCMNLPTTKNTNGVIGVSDFRGDLIRSFRGAGFVYHSEVCIWKDPVVAMQRTKALGLLHKQLCKDSAMSRQGIPDYLVTMRKPGENEKPISGALEYYVGDSVMPGFVRHERSDGALFFTPEAGGTPVDIWARYASPVWMDINPTRTLQYMLARDGDDERHISPTQLDVIERAMQLWTRPGDVVLSPFMGIGSEGYVALQTGRKFIGAELKESYFNVAVNNLDSVDNGNRQQQLFG